MNAAGNIAVLDVGKTNAKLVIVDARSGKEVAARNTANRVIDSGPYPHHDVDALWQFFTEALRSFAREPGFDAISVTAHGAAAALLGADKLAMPVIDYEFIYPETVQAEYDAIRPDFAETGSPRLPGGLNVGAQLHYQKTCFPADFANVRKIVTYAQYWTWRLTGIAVNELTSLGCHTDLWNPHQGGFSSLVGRLGIAGLLAPIMPAFEPIGKLTPGLTQALGLPAPVPVYCGIHDSNASLLPHLVSREAPFSVISTGTWVVCFAAGGQIATLDPLRDTLINIDAHGNPVPSARFMGGREFDIACRGNAATEPDAATIARVIENRHMILPALVAGSGPFPQTHAAVPDLAALDPEERVVVASLYAALMTQTCLQLIGGAGITIVEGPFARNGVYLSALRTSTERDVIAWPGSTGTSLGAAILAGAQAPSSDGGVMATPLDVDFSDYARLWHQRARAS